MDECLHTTNGAWRATDGRFYELPDRRVPYDDFDPTEQERLAAVVARLAPRAANGSPMLALQAVSALRRRVDDLEREVVALARARSWSWRDIADMLGVHRSTVHRRFGSDSS